MVRIYLADITSLYDQETYGRYYRAAPLWRREKADRIKPAKGKAQSIGAWSLRNVAAAMAGAAEDYGYNLSHSGDYALCAINDSLPGQAVGCDIETVKDFQIKIAKRFFCKEEYDRLMQIKDEQERTALFYRFWVLKESFMKATRQGMQLPMDSFEISFDCADRPFLARQPLDYPECYYYKEYTVPGVNAKIAVCTTGDAAQDIEIINL